MIKIQRKNETLTATLEGTTKIHTTYKQRTYINNTLNHRIYQKLPDGQNRRIAECSLTEITLKLNESQTRATGVRNYTFKDEEQETITIPSKNIYHTDLDGRLYQDNMLYAFEEHDKHVLNKHFNEFIQAITTQAITIANEQLARERRHIHQPFTPRKNKYTLEKATQKTIITLNKIGTYHNKYLNESFYNDTCKNQIRYDDQNDVYTIALMSLHKIIFNKHFSELKTLTNNDIQFQFRAGNNKLLNITLPLDPEEYVDEITRQISPEYFYYNMKEGISKTAEYLADFMNMVLVEIFRSDVLEFDTNELSVEITPVSGNAGETIELEARIIDPYGDSHEGEIRFYLED